jgi:hypothetical protein
MEQPVKTIAVVPSIRGSAIQSIFRDLVERWRSTAARGGLAPAFIVAIETGVPILTSVSAQFEDAWRQFAAPMYVVLPADSDTIDQWWRVMRQADRRPERVAVGECAK